jgi:hypothetical protein
MLLKVGIFFRDLTSSEEGDSTNEKEGEDNVNTIYEEESNISPGLLQTEPSFQSSITVLLALTA